MCRTLPLRPNVEEMRREARNLLRDLLRREATAVARYYSLDPLADTCKPRLADAQYLIAREYGCASWRKLEERLRSRVQESAEITASVLPKVAVKP